MSGQILTRQQLIGMGDHFAQRNHRRYYAQLVNERTISHVVSSIGRERLLASADPHFNDIPLQEWDRVCGFSFGMVHRADPSKLPVAMRFEALGDYPTPSGLISTAKEAARQYVEREKANAGQGATGDD